MPLSILFFVFVNFGLN